jgi:hypothetical protein
MKPSAAGRKTDDAVAGFGRHMDDLLEAMTQGVRTALKRADDCESRVKDPYNERGAEIHSAAQLGEVCVKLIQAAGKLSGEFHHNITVRRSEGDTPHDP